MQGPSVLSEVTLIRDWEVTNEVNKGYEGILQTCLGLMSKLFLSVFPKCSATELYPSPNHDC